MHKTGSLPACHGLHRTLSKLQMAKPRHVQKSVEISRPSKIPFAGASESNISLFSLAWFTEHLWSDSIAILLAPPPRQSQWCLRHKCAQVPAPSARLLVGDERVDRGLEGPDRFTQCETGPICLKESVTLLTSPLDTRLLVLRGVVGWMSGASSPDAVHKPKRHLEHGTPLDCHNTI